MQNGNEEFRSPKKEADPPLFSTRNLNDNNCGLTPNIEDDRIVGGKESGPLEYPWNVALTLPWGVQFCGGSLINKWVRRLLVKLDEMSELF